MTSSNNNSPDQFEGIYFQDFLKKDKHKHVNTKNVFLYIICHVLLVSIGLGIYILISGNNLSNANTRSTKPSKKSSESYSLEISQSDVSLNIDDDETELIDVSVNKTKKSNKSMSIDYVYSKTISLEEVSNDNGTVTFKLIPQKIGNGYIEFKLIDSKNNSTVYDTKRIDITVNGTLSSGTFDNHTYRVFEESLTWTEAKIKCEENGGHLATISSYEEQEFIQNIIKSVKKENLWIGGFYSDETGSWTWVDNSEWNYTNWDVSQPDNYSGDEYFLRIKNRDRIYEGCEANDGMWNDTADSADGIDEDKDVSLITFGYVCEWDSDESKVNEETLEIPDNSFIITLYPEYAPITCENFEKLVNEGFYNGLTFHRVVEDFMAQGGDPLGNGTGGSEHEIKGEFSSNGVENSLSHQRGIVSMARSAEPNSASSQFFICYVDCSFLDGNYASFGEVTYGMEIVDSFLEVPRSLGGDNAISLPNTQIIIEEARMLSQDDNNHPRVLVTMNNF